METVRTAPAGVVAAVEETGADVTADVTLEELADVASVLDVADVEGRGGAEAGVSGGQSEPASEGRSQGMISR